MNPAIKQQIEHITCDAEIQEAMRKHCGDNNIIYNYYDRNTAIRCAVDSVNGKATGTCIKESMLEYLRLKADGYRPKIYMAQIYSKPLGRIINHQYLTIMIDRKEYFDSRSNGLHKRVPLEYWLEQNKPLTIKRKRIEITYKKTKPNKSTHKDNHRSNTTQWMECVDY
jgi:hypothetical protein